MDGFMTWNGSGMNGKVAVDGFVDGNEIQETGFRNDGLLKTEKPRAPPTTVASTAKAQLHACTVPDCGKQFNRKSNLKAHMRLHTGEMPYTCNVPGCRKTFRWKSCLSTHERVHRRRTQVSPGVGFYRSQIMPAIDPSVNPSLYALSGNVPSRAIPQFEPYNQFPLDQAAQFPLQNQQMPQQQIQMKMEPSFVPDAPQQVPEMGMSRHQQQQQQRYQQHQQQQLLRQQQLLLQQHQQPPPSQSVHHRMTAEAPMRTQPSAPQQAIFEQQDDRAQFLPSHRRSDEPEQRIRQQLPAQQHMQLQQENRRLQEMRQNQQAPQKEQAGARPAPSNQETNPEAPPVVPVPEQIGITRAEQLPPQVPFQTSERWHATTYQAAAKPEPQRVADPLLQFIEANGGLLGYDPQMDGNELDNRDNDIEVSELERRMSNRLLAERPADLIFGREGERSSVGEERKGEASMSIPTGLRLPRSTMDVDQIDLQVGSTGSFGLSFTKIPNVDVDLANDKWSNSSFKSGFLPNMSLDKQASQGLLPNNNGRPLGHSLLSPQYVYLLGSPPLNYEGPQPSLREAFGMKNSSRGSNCVLSGHQSARNSSSSRSMTRILTSSVRPSGTSHRHSSFSRFLADSIPILDNVDLSLESTGQLDM